MKIESIGYYLPPSASLSAFIEQFPEGWQYPIHKKAGIEQVRKVNIGEYSLSLAKKAVERCMATSRYNIKDIDVVICCNICKYDFENEVTIEPATSVSVAQHFGLKDAECFDINNACAGVFTGLYTAKSMIASKAAKRILVVSGEYITKLGETVLKESEGNSQFSKQDLMASLTLSDSAVAMIVEEGQEGIGFTDIQLQTYGEYSHLCTGFPMENGPVMLTKSAELAQRATEYSADHVVNTMYQNNWEKEEIRFLIPHQTAEKVIYKAIIQVNNRKGDVHFDLDNTLVNLKKRGNTSTTTHFIALMDKILEGEINEGDKIVFSISASGITVGTALYDMDDLPKRIRLGMGEKSAPIITEKPATIPVNISGVANLPNDYRGRRKTFEMISPVLKELLSKRKETDAKIGLIVFSGMYVTDHISEPAVAAMILKEIGLTPEEQSKYFSSDLLAFDIKNGSLGTQKAMESAQMILQHNEMEQALVISSEVSHSSIDSLVDFPTEHSASVLLVSKNNRNAKFVMTESQHYNFWEHISDYKVCITWGKGEIGLQSKKCNFLHQKYLNCIELAVNRFFEETGTSWTDYSSIAIPAISKLFKTEFFNQFSQVALERVLEIPTRKDAFTANVPLALEQWSQRKDESDTLLQIQVGAGMQVHVSVWKK